MPTDYLFLTQGHRVVNFFFKNNKRSAE